jgi:hypothetical protein
MDEIFDANSLFIPLPIWFIGHRDRKLDDLLKGFQADDIVVIPIFTDEDLAKTFLESRPKSEYVPIPVTDENAIIGLLNAIRARGITHVNLDGSPGKQSRSYPVGDFRTMFQRAVDKDEAAG